MVALKLKKPSTDAYKLLECSKKPKPSWFKSIFTLRFVKTFGIVSCVLELLMMMCCGWMYLVETAIIFSNLVAFGLVSCKRLQPILCIVAIGLAVTNTYYSALCLSDRYETLLDMGRCADFILQNIVHIEELNVFENRINLHAFYPFWRASYVLLSSLLALFLAVATPIVSSSKKAKYIVSEPTNTYGFA